MTWKLRNIFLILTFIFIFPFFLRAQTLPSPTDLQSKIDDRNTQIKQLEDEISQYNTQLANTQSQANTLQNTLKTLDLTNKKITTDITLTNTKITKTTLTIEQLNEQIPLTQKQIDSNTKAVISALQNIDQMENFGFLQLILSHQNVSDVWTDIDNVNQIENTIREKTKELSAAKTSMQTQQASLIAQKNSLTSLKQDLSSQKQAITATAQEKSTLLVQTKNKESAFQALIVQKQAEENQFQDEVNNFEAQLHIAINTASYPTPEHGILSWPLDNPPTQASCDTGHKVASCIVRGFYHPIIKNGVTVDPGHNGVDFRASVGTKVKNVLDGVVAGTGNTDIYRGCYGLGKWVMVNHPNGLSSIYMHLSVISVSTGQTLKTGDLIGLSGNTGASQAPHLHVTVYATEGVEIRQFTNSIGCKQAVVPLADPKAYLDPLTYFPTI